MYSRFRLLGVLSCAFLALPASSLAQLRVATFAPGPPPAPTGGAGTGEFNPIGQVFRAPTTATSLQSLTYWFTTVPGIFTGGGNALLSLFPFTGTPPSGIPLFETAFTFPTGLLTPITWTPGITLTGGALYIALIQSSAPPSALSLLAQIPDSPDNTTGDVLRVCRTVVGDCPVGTLIAGIPQVALFEANFVAAAVPEPGSAGLLATGLLAVAWMVGHHRRRRA
jgi:hypothetical protein